MAKPLSADIRDRFRRLFEDGLSGREAARRLMINDMRGTAVTLLSEAGATIPQICSITGHTLQSATRILARYLAMTDALSSAAIRLFENAPETAFANRMQTKEPPEGAALIKVKENQ